MVSTQIAALQSSALSSKSMNKLPMIDILTLGLSMIIGGICLYVYLCFQGVFTAFLVDIGYYKLISKAICSLGEPGNFRKIVFVSIFFLKDVLVQIFMCLVFIYWFALLFRKRILLSALFALIGAIIADYYLYFKYSGDPFGPVFSYTMLFDGILANYLFNIFLWFSVFIISITLSSALKVRQKSIIIKTST